MNSNTAPLFSVWQGPSGFSWPIVLSVKELRALGFLHAGREAREKDSRREGRWPWLDGAAQTVRGALLPFIGAEGERKVAVPGALFALLDVVQKRKSPRSHPHQPETNDAISISEVGDGWRVSVLERVLREYPSLRNLRVPASLGHESVKGGSVSLAVTGESFFVSDTEVDTDFVFVSDCARTQHLVFFALESGNLGAVEVIVRSGACVSVEEGEVGVLAEIRRRVEANGFVPKGYGGDGIEVGEFLRLLSRLEPPQERGEQAESVASHTSPLRLDGESEREEAREGEGERRNVTMRSPERIRGMLRDSENLASLLRSFVEAGALPCSASASLSVEAPAGIPERELCSAASRTGGGTSLSEERSMAAVREAAEALESAVSCLRSASAAAAARGVEVEEGEGGGESDAHLEGEGMETEREGHAGGNGIFAEGGETGTSAPVAREEEEPRQRARRGRAALDGFRRFLSFLFPPFRRRRERESSPSRPDTNPPRVSDPPPIPLESSHQALAAGSGLALHDEGSGLGRELEGEAPRGVGLGQEGEEAPAPSSSEESRLGAEESCSLPAPPELSSAVASDVALPTVPVPGAEAEKESEVERVGEGEKEEGDGSKLQRQTEHLPSSPQSHSNRPPGRALHSPPRQPPPSLSHSLARSPSKRTPTNSKTKAPRDDTKHQSLLHPAPSASQEDNTRGEDKNFLPTTTAVSSREEDQAHMSVSVSSRPLRASGGEGEAATLQQGREGALPGGPLCRVRGEGVGNLPSGPTTPPRPESHLPLTHAKGGDEKGTESKQEKQNRTETAEVPAGGLSLDTPPTRHRRAQMGASFASASSDQSVNSSRSRFEAPFQALQAALRKGREDPRGVNIRAVSECWEDLVWKEQQELEEKRRHRGRGHDRKEKEREKDAEKNQSGKKVKEVEGVPERDRERGTEKGCSASSSSSSFSSHQQIYQTPSSERERQKEEGNQEESGRGGGERKESWAELQYVRINPVQVPSLSLEGVPPPQDAQTAAAAARGDTENLEMNSVQGSSSSSFIAPPPPLSPSPPSNRNKRTNSSSLLQSTVSLWGRRSTMDTMAGDHAAARVAPDERASFDMRGKGCVGALQGIRSSSPPSLPGDSDQETERGGALRPLAAADGVHRTAPLPALQQSATGSLSLGLEAGDGDGNVPDNGSEAGGAGGDKDGLVTRFPATRRTCCRPFLLF
uniref:Uncharacterized protein n=1 Tax=Chromera velia CCMP2878 TaxID=1169474 RepID=A0A0G4HDL9_9ALVE|eukprot:Cvel_26423.t1-p1 / transcript=Cvel_26423.t1 / gene=Cvel_26423 / organism=Chromera_velia_CCMP2878 / gene_product=hypothetical protein / transcript_product=hypothetical protein / location=Cvel_scaffold3137:9166-13123(+) / protein_length=1195 / sequence_SO=supercontig / SO=protein_coding / is_pseudo=false